MHNLFSLSAKYQSLMNTINENDEITNDVMDELLSVNDSIDQKVLNYTAIIKSLDAKADAIKHAMELMEKRKKSLNNSANRLKVIVKIEMEKCDKRNIENEYHRASLKLSIPKVILDDESVLPSEYFRKKIVEKVEANLIKISKALKENIQVPGAHLVQGYRLEIS